MKRRFIHVHIPKTAGTSIESALLDSSCILRRSQWDTGICAHSPLNHLTLQEIENSGVIDSVELKDYFVFTVVRNPWDRCISELFCPWMGSHYGRGNLKQRLVKLLDSDPLHNHRRPQVDYLAAETRTVDFVARFENLPEDFRRITRRIGVTARLLHLNATGHRPYWEYYDEEMIAMVGNRYERDIERFGYRFRA